MADLVVDVTREKWLYRTTIDIDGQVQSTRVFGCRDALGPVVDALEATCNEHHGVGSSAKPDMGSIPALITFVLPSGGILTYRLGYAEKPGPKRPQLFR
jgi:hypothetical protein